MTSGARSSGAGRYVLGDGCSFPKTGHDQDVCYPQTLPPGDEPPGGMWFLDIDVHRLYTAPQVPETVQEVVFCLSPPDSDEAMNPVPAEQL